MDPLEVETVIEDSGAGPAPSSKGQNGTAWLVVLAGPQLGRKIPLTREQTTIGRSGEADVRLQDASLSRKHAVVRCLPGGAYELEDLGSRNGTFTDGIRLYGPYLVQPSDKIQLGSRVTLQFMVEDASNEEPVARQRLETIGRVSATITHDFNNLLSVLEANTCYLQELELGTPLGEESVRDCLDDMRAATRHAAELTRSLAALAQRHEERHGSVSVSDLCEEVVRFIQRVVPMNIEVRSEIAPSLMVEGSRTRLHQLLLNPCINARDAMPQGGVLTIRARMGTSLQTKHQLIMEIEDTGQGMDEETAKRAFNPFFTTKGARGTGLGLATVAQVAREHGGSVELESGPNRGTTLRVTLPAAVPNLSAPIHVTAPTQAQRASEGLRVLLVEDEPRVARSAARALRAHGHEVALVCDGVEAIECLKRECHDVVVVDLDTPHIDGPTCVQRLRELAPTLRVIFISGSASPALEAELRGLGADDLVPKPLDIRRLSRTIAARPIANRPSSYPAAAR